MSHFSLPGDITPESGDRLPLFSAYDARGVQIGNDRFEAGLQIHRGEILAPWGPQHIRQLTVEVLREILATPPEVVIIGTGRTTQFPDMAILDAFADIHLGLECMDTRAAARTYNILVTEGREVSVAMLPPGA